MFILVDYLRFIFVSDPRFIFVDYLKFVLIGYPMVVSVVIDLRLDEFIAKDHPFLPDELDIEDFSLCHTLSIPAPFEECAFLSRSKVFARSRLFSPIQLPRFSF